MSYYYLPKISLFSDSISIREAKGTQVKGFNYQEFVLADSVRVLLENYSSYIHLHHVGEFSVFQRVNYADWNKKPMNYILLENPSSLPYSWHLLDWDGFGHKAKKTSTYEIIPVDSTGKRISIDIQTDQHRVVLLFSKNNNTWVKVDPLIHDAIYALEY